MIAAVARSGGVRRALRDEPLRAGARLLELPGLEVHLSQPGPREGAHISSALPLVCGHEAIPRLRGLPGLTQRFRAQGQRVGARGRVEIETEQLRERPLRLPGELLLDDMPGEQQAHRHREGALLVERLEPRGLIACGVEVIEIEEGPHQAGPRPRGFARIRIGDEEPAIGLHRVERLARLATPPAQAHETGLDQELRARCREDLQPLGGARRVAQTAERVTQPVRGLGGERARQAAVQQRRPLVARLRVPLEGVEGEGPAVSRGGHQLRRHAAAQEALEDVEGTLRVAALERDPAQRVRGVES
jgi:hypothetical protein